MRKLLTSFLLLLGLVTGCATYSPPVRYGVITKPNVPAAQPLSATQPLFTDSLDKYYGFVGINGITNSNDYINDVNVLNAPSISDQQLSVVGDCVKIGANGLLVDSGGACGGSGSPGGTSGQIQYNNAGAFGGFTLSGDCTIVPSTGVITCTKYNGASLAAGTGLSLSGSIFSLNINAGTTQTCSAHQFASSLTGVGIVGCAQPAFSDLSGDIATSQLTGTTTGVVFAMGTLSNNEIVHFPAPIALTFPSTFGSGNTTATCSTNPSESDAYTLKSGGTSLATLTVSTGCALSYSTTLGSHAAAAGEKLELDAPATASGNVSFSIQVTR